MTVSQSNLNGLKYGLLKNRILPRIIPTKPLLFADMNFPDPNVTTEYESPDGLKYVWNGFAWEIACAGGGAGGDTSDYVTKDELKDYVLKAGDHMTGDLTVGDEITLEEGGNIYAKSISSLPIEDQGDAWVLPDDLNLGHMTNSAKSATNPALRL